MQRLQFLAGLEADRFAGRNRHFRTRAGIAPDAGFAGTYLENSESPKFDTLLPSQCFFTAPQHHIVDRVDFQIAQRCGVSQPP